MNYNGENTEDSNQFDASVNDLRDIGKEDDSIWPALVSRLNSRLAEILFQSYVLSQYLKKLIHCQTLSFYNK